MKLFSLGPFIGKEFGKAHKKSWTADRLARKGLITLQPVLYVTKLKKQLIIYWYLVFSACKFGLLSYRASVYNHLNHKLWICPLRTGGLMQAIGLLVKNEKGSTPLSSYAPGPFGTIEVTVCLTESLLACPVSLQPSKKRCISGLLLGLEEFLVSSPLQLQPLRWLWSGVLGLVLFLL